MIDNTLNNATTKRQQIAFLLLFSYLTPWLYTIFSQFWVVHGGSSITLNAFEFPLLITFSLIIYFNPYTSRVLSRYTFAPPLTILGIYILYDVLYSYFARSPRLSDCKNILSLYSVSPLLFFGFFIILLVIAMPTIVSFVAWSSCSRTKTRVLTMVVKISALAFLLLFISSSKSYQYQQTELQFNTWSNEGNVRKNGRITSSLYYYNKRQDTLAAIGAHKHFSIFNQFYPDRPQHKRNIHIIILESFADPRLIQNFTYTPSPIHTTLQAFLTKDSQFSLITTPVYGGGTAQSEFEILTGIPALAQIDSIDFNLFEGNASSSLVQMLRNIGYHTMASVATEPVFYNAKLAYKGIGFDEVHFLGENSYFEEKEDHYLFDGDFLEANSTYIKKYLSQKGGVKPLLNYVVGMFGHIPFERNKKLRPDAIAMEPDNDQIFAMVNQFYYRTKALGKFLQNLQELDPHSIVLITSDHLPPIFNTKDVLYKHTLKTNVALLLNDFDLVDISGKTVYETSHIIWNLLGEPNVPVDTSKLFTKQSKEDVYFSFILEAMGLRPLLLPVEKPQLSPVGMD